MENIIIKPIAVIRTDFPEKFGIPRQSGRIDSLIGRIVFLPEYRSHESLREIESFSHLWLLFDFSLAHRETWSPTVRPPRLGGNRRIGVFASRSPYRPNPIGLSSVRLLRIEKTEGDGEVLIVSGADLLDGTPILDIKPYLPFSDCHPDAVGGYADEQRDYHLRVECPPELLESVPEEKRSPLLSCLADDPRPSYQNDPSRVYGMRFSGFEVRFTVHEDILNVIEIRKEDEV
ncbi:MAG: tRNA (N6-threonylcarbamoyladenosine(37)-N6)-methyltransferase TrmO [Ruminococcus sp.]|nr:tRNA (N6-threonylcarbamoyladenosine(37)-N6)-methyltransferase TrmO [Candidatus Apopatosoma intestinale]